MKNNNNNNSISTSNNNNNNDSNSSIQATRPNPNNNQSGRSNSEHQQHYHDKRKPYQNNQNQHHHHQQQQQQQPYKGHSRERSGQRGQFPDSSMGGGGGGGRGEYMNRQQNVHMNLGAVKFASGEPTRELPAVVTRTDPEKKFSGRCRLFVANLAHNTTEEKLRTLFEKFGEIGEIFISPKQNTYAFIKLDSKQNAEAAREALDCTTFDGRILRVRLASHPAAIRVKHLSSEVTDELLAYAFRFFGEIERAVVILNKKGKSTGEGIVEFVNRQSAAYALKKCETESFMLTSSLQPVLVEKFDPLDEDEGYPESGVNKNSIEFKEQREVGPRFAVPGTFEHNFGLRWKELYAVEQAKREQLENEILSARKELLDQIKYSKIEHDTVALRNQLQQLEDTRLKLQQFKEQTVNSVQNQEDYRRQQDLMLRQREDDILRRQQLGANPQQGMATRVQDESSNREHSNANQPDRGSAQPKDGPEVDSGLSPPIHFAPTNQPVSFAEAGLMNLGQQPYIQMHPQMVIPPPTQNSTMNHPMYAPYMQQQQQMMTASTANPSYVPMAAAYSMAPQQQNNNPQQSQHNQSGQYRPQQKFRRDYQNQGNNSSANTSDGNNRGRKRNKQY